MAPSKTLSKSPAQLKERELQISPLYIPNIVFNKLTISYIRNVTSLAFGICAGILQLESIYGFLFYFVASTLVSFLIQVLVVGSSPLSYFVTPKSDVFWAEIVSCLSSYVLMWTLFYGLVTA
ncbi:uncharacterized protein SAPINGB_P005566 [Magnusiomyces paraingens]|uniref:ER membrane protein complex subunit 6 n=1 Tax=Magnusiomyces paraingens TaxID=2606893 RepID=A0A5E8C0C9_9ASCO|nr:uncharacterized protein SAPINGB_P005566 [Saprochaete ingens]VVT57164.1 unnamed protein product [Saprochaete ingens]